MLVDQNTLSSLRGKFTWFYGMDWFVETEVGNFHWKDPDYGKGDNSLTMFAGNYDEFCRYLKMPYGRDKGTRPVHEMCGKSFTLVILQE